MARSFVRRRSSTGSQSSLSAKDNEKTMAPNAPVDDETTEPVDTKKYSKMKRMFDTAKKTASAMKPAPAVSSPTGASTASASPKFPQGDGTVNVDKYGFLIEEQDDDRHSSVAGGGGSTLDVKRWEAILEKSPAGSSPGKSFLTSHSTKVKYCARRGVPDSLRQKAWTVLTGVDALMADNPRKYAMLVDRAEAEYRKMRALEESGDAADIGRVGTLLEAIERDIHRTFPKHYMFSSGFGNDDDDDENEGIDDTTKQGDEQNESDPKIMVVSDEEDDSCESDNACIDMDEIADRSTMEAKKEMFRRSIQMSIRQMSSLETDDLLESFGRRRESNGNVADRGSATENANDASSARLRSRAPAIGHGQGALRNVLRAYLLYDPDVGYCQGMNFIAAMFLTFLPEEESFWLLVRVMNREPHRCRDLFGEDMAGTHEVLYVAERLLEQFLPDLSRHLEAEGVHVTMFVTQWLVTLYVREFPFDLVARVWDSFLVEGWKVIYRVMLSLMEGASKDVLGMRFEQILHYFRDFPSTVDGETVMAGSLKIALKTKHIEKHANEWRRLNAGSD